MPPDNLRSEAAQRHQKERRKELDRDIIHRGIGGLLLDKYLLYYETKSLSHLASWIATRLVLLP
jgi:hypothetical protein